MFKRIPDPPDTKLLPYQKLLTPEALSEAATAEGLRDMQGLAARIFGGRSAAEPGPKLMDGIPPTAPNSMNNLQ